MEEQQYLQELLASPFGLQKIDQLDGYPIYSSDSLKERFNTSIMTLKSLKPCLSKVVSLVKEGRIIPCVSYGGFLSYIVKKTISHKSNIMFQGAYDVNKNLIYIVADMKFMDFLKVDEHLADIVLHELMHYCAKKNPRVFYSIFKAEIQKYYMGMMYHFAGAKIDKKQADAMGKYIFKQFELGEKADFVKYTRFLNEMFTGQNFNGPIDKTVATSTMIVSAKTLFHGFDAVIRLVQSDQDVRRLIMAMYTTYIKEFGIRDPDTTPIQELIYPSEIPAITSIRANNMHYSAINKIA